MVYLEGLGITPPHFTEHLTAQHAPFPVHLPRPPCATGLRLTDGADLFCRLTARSLRIRLPAANVCGMSYAFPFHRLVLAGDLYAEHFSTSLSVATGAAASPVDDDLLEDLAAVVGTWFASVGSTGPQITNRATLKEFKVNRIGTDGSYMDPVSFTHVYSTPVAGGTALESAPQLAGVVSLRTAFDRGRASKGQMYLPPSFGYNIPGTDGLVTTTNAQNRASSVATLINAIHAAYTATVGGGDFGGRVAVVSDVGSGAWHSVTHVEAGRVIDTMRSRRTSLPEDYQPSAVTIT